MVLEKMLNEIFLSCFRRTRGSVLGKPHRTKCTKKNVESQFGTTNENAGRG